MKKRLIIIGIIVVLIAAGVEVLVWERNTKQTISKPTIEELGKQAVEKQTEIDSIEQQLKDLPKEYTLEKEAKRKRDLEILSAQNVSDDVSVEGVEIIKQGDKKIIKNNAQGYSMEVPSNLVIARSISSDQIELHEKGFICDKLFCEPIIGIGVKENQSEISLDQGVAKYYEDLGISVDTRLSKNNKIILNANEAYKIPAGNPNPKLETFNYFLSRGKHLYFIRIPSFYDTKYHLYLETFKLN